jgi:multidrug resistance efflux pump
VKSLQKLSHSRPSTPAERARLRLVEAEKVAARERRIWLHRLRRSIPVLVAAALLATVFALVIGLRRVADGLVLAHRVEVQAPARVLVAETFVQPGATCAPGDPLIRLAAVTGQSERGRLLALIDSRRHRLAWFDAGGEAEEFGRTLRSDLLAEARLARGEAETEREVALAQLEGLRRERDELQLSLARDIERQEGDIAVLVDREVEAAARVREVQADLALAGFDIEAAEQLNGTGVISRRDVVSSRLERAAYEFSNEGYVASARALASELEAARKTLELDRERGEAALALADARAEAARREVLAVERRMELWAELAEHHARLDPGAPDVPRLRRLRRSVLESELAEAEAQLAAHDEDHGERTITAQTGGVVDQVFVDPGAMLEKDAPLLAYHDPGALRVVAYVTPELAPTVSVGQACRLVAEGDHSEVEAVVASIGSAWTQCPTSLPRRTTRASDLRVPVVIEVPTLELAEHFHPNMRLKITFAGGGFSAFRRQVASWFGG